MAGEKHLHPPLYASVFSSAKWLDKSFPKLTDHQNHAGHFSQIQIPGHHTAPGRAEALGWGTGVSVLTARFANNELQ